MTQIELVACCVALATAMGLSMHAFFSMIFTGNVAGVAVEFGIGQCLFMLVSIRVKME